MMARVAELLADLFQPCAATKASLAYTCTPNGKAPSAWQDGYAFSFVPNADNDGGANTINPHALGAKPLRFISGTNLVAGALKANVWHVGCYDSANDEVLVLAAGGSAEGTQINWAKGADIASAAALTPGTDGNFFDVTGTTTITSIATLGVGTVIVLQFDGALTLTHHATDLILPGGANITTAAGDVGIFVEYASGDWHCINYSTSAASGDLISSNNLSDVSSASTSFDNIKQAATTSATGVVEEATDAEVRASTDSKFLDACHLNTAAAYVTLTDGASIAVDWSTFINGTVTLGGNRTLANPTNEVVGQWRFIEVVQDGTGSRTLSFGSEYDFPGGSAPTLSTGANEIDTLAIHCRSTTKYYVYHNLDLS
jgi:hypothetical protein